MAGKQDTEITLGTGRILTLFFGLVAVCGLFFGMGYSLGKSSTKSEIVQTQPGPEPKSVAKAEKNAPAPKPNPADGMTFFQAVKQSDTTGEKDATDTSFASSDSNNAPASETKEEKESATAKADPLVGMLSGNSGYLVQVAAVTKKEDAEALVSALRKKSYQVSASTNEPHDKLYHVQVGPFADIKEAETMRARLVGDGYNPILKR